MADQASFDRSKKEVAEIEKSVKKTGAEFDKFVGNAVKGLLTLGAGALGAAGAVSMIQGKMTITAAKAGMTYTELNKVSTALKLIGLNSDGVSGKMAAVNSALSDYKMGKNTEAYTKLATDLALMHIDTATFEKMSPTERIKAVSDRAQSQTDPGMRTAYRDAAEDLLGLGDMLLTFDQRGSKYRSFAQLQSSANGKPMATGSDAMANSQAFTGLTTSLSGIWDIFGESMAKGFRPIIESLTSFIDNHGPEIKNFFDDVTSVITNLATAMGPIFEKLSELTGGVVGSLANKMNVADQWKKNPSLMNKNAEALRNSGIEAYESYAPTRYIFDRNSIALGEKAQTSMVNFATNKSYAQSLAAGITDAVVQDMVNANKGALLGIDKSGGGMHGFNSTVGTINFDAANTKIIAGMVQKEGYSLVDAIHVRSAAMAVNGRQ